jgi:diacylglycerol kinase family enzyme
VRALLIVNPHATTTTQLRRDVIAHALASQMDLEVVETRYRGHAASLAEMAAADGHQLVLTLGGDGTVNEAVNGLLRSASAPCLDGGPAGAAPASTAPASTAPGGAAPAARPSLAALPGGNANVFTRALGLPADLIDATGHIIQAVQAGRHRNIGLGRIDLTGLASRYFTFNAGLGLDAEVVRVIEGLRARGRPATSWLYVLTALRQFYAVTDRRHPALTLECDGRPPVGHLFMGIVSNTSPWTYLGHRPVNPSPRAAFDTGLDLFALRRLRTISTLNALRQMITPRGAPLSGRDVVSLHDQPEFRISSGRPVAVQIDGEYVGEHEVVTFRSVPDALRVIA